MFVNRILFVHIFVFVTIIELIIGWAICISNGAEPIEASNFGTLTDKRDGKKYRTVNIGNQIWMTENLNYAIADSWCYNNIDSNCVKYGRLYPWDVAIEACPAEWYLPSDEDWYYLEQAVGGEDVAGQKLRSKTWIGTNGDTGTDVIDFAALPGGSGDRYDGFYGIGTFGCWWTSTKTCNNKAFYRTISNGTTYQSITSNMVNRRDSWTSQGRSIRCVNVYNSSKSKRRKSGGYNKTLINNMFTDTRDGKQYKSVQIGNHIWMAENLNYTTDSSWCYDNTDSNCAKYGRLYTWDAAMAACPIGWHLPNRKEWDNLVCVAGGADNAHTGGRLKSKTLQSYDSGLEYTDALGFTALCAGHRYINYRKVIFGNIDMSAYWWSSTEKRSGVPYYRSITMYDGDGGVYETVFEDTIEDKDYSSGEAMSVRCVKDY